MTVAREAERDGQEQFSDDMRETQSYSFRLIGKRQETVWSTKGVLVIVSTTCALDIPRLLKPASIVSVSERTALVRTNP